MIGIAEASLSMLSVHQVGNKTANQPLRLSEQAYELNDEMLHSLLARYFLKPFEKANVVYRFFHVNDHLELNGVYQYARKMFAGDNFHESTRDICRQLYEVADHPNIKGGEVYITSVKNLIYNGEAVDAIGIFKSESKEPYLTVSANDRGFDLGYQEQAINIKKLDKGCIILDTGAEEGFDVLVTDQTNVTDTVYWVDKFLGLKQKQTEFTQTTQLLDAYRSFVDKELDQTMQLTPTDKIDLLNRSIQYFKEKDHFQMDEFAYEVIANDEAIDRFKEYKQFYERDFEVSIEDGFAISNTATKKQARLFKSVLKLDKNFHVYIHGNTELIEKGYDEQRRKKYYKIYFDEEQ